MHLVLLTARWPTLSETFVRQDVANLRRLGHEVTVGALRGDDGEPPDLLAYPSGGPFALAANMLLQPVLSTRALIMAARLLVTADPPTRMADRLKLPIQALAAARLATRLRERCPEHLHAHFAHAPATVGMLTAALLDIPFSFTGHANDLFARRSLLATKLRKAALVACISRWHRELYRGIVDRPDEAYPVIRCGVDLARFEVKRRSRSREPAALLTIARLVEKKGLDTLLRAVAGLGAGEVRLRIAGDGPDRRRLEALRRELGIEDRVEFLGAVPHDGIPGLLAEADLFVLPCRPDARGDRDGIPVALMEAMAAGVPVVAGDLPAIRELVEDGRSGLLIDGTDRRATAAAIRRLLADPDLARDVATAGRRTIETEFSADVNGRRLAAAIEGAAAEA